MEEYIFSILTALISGVITYLIARSGNKKDIEIIKLQNKSEMEKLMNQHKIDIEGMKEKHKLEILKLENENEIKKTTEIANNESINTATNQIFGSIFNRKSVQEQLDKAIKETFDKNKK